MAKLICMSVLFLTITLPAIAARDPNPMRGFKKAIVWVALFNLVYTWAVLTWIPVLRFD
jgi:hypothetical protein